jgi:uncharacterized protein YkwD
MNLIDAFLLLLILLVTYFGFRKGFILGAVDLFLLVASTCFAFWAYPYLGLFFQKYIPALGVWKLPVSFILCFLAVRFLLGAVMGRILSNVSTDTHRSLGNRLLGLVPGFINGVIYAAIISALLLGSPFFDSLSKQTRESRITTKLIPYVESAEHALAPVFDDAISQTMNHLTVNPSSHEAVDLSFTVNDPTVRPDLEAEMLLLVNQERNKVGLPSLVADPEMQEVARAHSRDMFAKGYFSHTNKEGKSLADRAHEAQVAYTTAGENLAFAQTLKLAHNGLMNSPGHRANILNKFFGRVGIGILDGGRHGLMVTQNFRN